MYHYSYQTFKLTYVDVLKPNDFQEKYVIRRFIGQAKKSLNKTLFVKNKSKTKPKIGTKQNQQ